MTSLATTSPAGVFKKLTVREAAVLLAMAWLIPFLVHLAPWSGARPLGAYLLPVFWATFIAVYFYGAGAGLLTGLLAPAVNLLVTGLPAWKSFGSLSLELVVFVLATTWAVRRAPHGWLFAPLGYLVAKSVSALLFSATTAFDGPGMAAVFFIHMLAGSAAGLIVLALINGALVKFYPKVAGPVEA
jgi:hypothetical protein